MKQTTKEIAEKYTQMACKAPRTKQEEQWLELFSNLSWHTVDECLPDDF